jgi:rhodanese-related sulfurtransferase
MPRCIYTLSGMFLEGAVVLAAGTALAFTANHFSPRGLELTRNYFPAPAVARQSSTAAVTTGPGATTTSASRDLKPIEAQLQEEGLQTVDRNQVSQLMRDPRFEQNLIVFLDARNHEEYRRGHIPGSYVFDYYRVQDYLPTVLPLCAMAEKIVVYCNGEKCDDSRKTATLLWSDAGIPKEKLFVYIGGWADWSTNKLPIELGDRSSGEPRAPNK